MKKYFVLCVLCLAAVMGVAAQDRNTAKKLFNEGRFVEAKPMFESLLQKNPKNSEYNFWYAACCLETGDSVDVEQMLVFAASRKIVNAYRYLGDWYNLERNYPLAIENYSEFIGIAKDDSLRNVVQERMNRCERLDRMIRNSQMVCIIDSIVVDKASFLSAYKIGKDVGSISPCTDFFGDDNLDGYVYVTQRGMDIYFSDENDDDEPLMKLYKRSMESDGWSDVTPLDGLDTNGNDNYPFMLSDGVTLYFASDGEGAIGGYDIFVSRYDDETGRFFRPDNVGMPFNSTANDYMMVINEVANLGWFATDRNQPEGKVCVYVFVPNEEPERVDVDAIGYRRALDVADISCIAETQTDDNVVRKATKQLALLVYAQEGGLVQRDFLFVLDDLNDYTSLDDFQNRKARELFREWRSRSKQYEKDVELLEQRRDEYASSSAAAKARMHEFILQLEEKLESDAEVLKRMEYEIRRLEQETIY